MNFKQLKSYGVGNTVMCTPAMIEYNRQTGKKVNACFESDHVRELFLDAPFMNIVDRMDQWHVHSGMINNRMPDYMYFWTIVKERFGLTDFEVLPGTYVDIPKVDPKDFIVIVRGCANPSKRKTKDPGETHYIKIIEEIQRKGVDVVMVGDGYDYQWNKNILETTKIPFVSGMRDALKYIAACQMFVSNDTGLYHVAGAMQKKGFIMWKDTNFIKNESPSGRFMYSHSNYWRDFYTVWKNIYG